MSNFNSKEKFLACKRSPNVYNLYVRWLLFLIPIVFVFCQGVNEKNTSGSSAVSEKTDLPSEEYIHAKVNISTGTHREATLEAEKLLSYREKGLSWGWNITLTFYDSTGNTTGHLVADSGFVRQNTNYTELFGSIVFTTSAEPMTLWCSQLSWNPDSDIVKSDKPVRLKRSGSSASKGEEIKAQGLESDLNFTNIRFIGEVKGKQAYEP